MDEQDKDEWSEDEWSEILKRVDRLRYRIWAVINDAEEPPPIVTIALQMVLGDAAQEIEDRDRGQGLDLVRRVAENWAAISAKISH
jgi:hypothetical protein